MDYNVTPNEDLTSSAKRGSRNRLSFTLLIILILSSIIASAVLFYYWQKGETSIVKREKKSDNSTATQTLESKLCNIAFDYPRTWKLQESYDEEHYCYYELFTDDPNLTRFVLHAEANRTWEDVMTEYENMKGRFDPKYRKSRKIQISGEEGIEETIIRNDPTKPSIVHINFHKNKSLYIIQYWIPESAKVKEEIEQVLSTVRFTGEDSAYDSYFTRTDSILSDDVHTMVIRDMDHIRDALLMYHTEHNQYPKTLQELEPFYIQEIPLQPFSGFQYNYIVDGESFLLKAILSDGSIYTATQSEKVTKNQ